MFEAIQDLRNNLSSLLNTASDGWVPPEDWEAAKSAHREVFEGMLQAVLTNGHPDDDEPINDGDLRAIWRFDMCQDPPAMTQCFQEGARGKRDSTMDDSLYREEALNMIIQVPSLIHVFSDSDREGQDLGGFK
jgi:hypothetical protein